MNIKLSPNCINTVVGVPQIREFRFGISGIRRSDHNRTGSYAKGYQKSGFTCGKHFQSVPGGKVTDPEQNGILKYRQNMAQQNLLNFNLTFFV